MQLVSCTPSTSWQQDVVTAVGACQARCRSQRGSPPSTTCTWEAQACATFDPLHSGEDPQTIPCRPLLVVGKGAALSQADTALRRLVDATGLPFLATAMGRGVVPDSHPGAVNAARSAALRGADVALIFGARCDHDVRSKK